MTAPSSPLPIEVALYFVQQLPSGYQQAILDWLLHNQAGSPPVPKRLPLRRGAGKHLISHIAPDFDAPLDDFNDYM